jgi:beta-glucosidase
VVLPYRDATLPIEKRVIDLLERMTLEEKVAQLGCVWSTALVADGAFSHERAAERLAHGTGHVTRIGASTGLRPAASAAFMNQIQRYLVEETRLGIPAIVHEESTGGFCARDADQFPQAIGLASSFDPELVERIGDRIRQQMLAVGARQTLAPVLDIARDPRWGRLEETYGEDPYLASRIGVAYVRGVQGASLGEGVAATGKHFLGYGLSEGGHNHKPAHLGPRELRDVFARPFLAAIQEAGLASIMNAYNEVDGLPCGGSRAILDDLLRGELGFRGVVVADYFTTRFLITSHRVAADPGDAGQLALEAGLDVELPQIDCFRALAERVHSGRLDAALVDRAVRRALALKFELGLFEQPYVDEARAAVPYQTPEARQLAREAAARSIVLLENPRGRLPLARGLRCVAVLGPCADDVRLLQGDYHYPAHVEIVFKAGRDAPEALPASGESVFAPGPYHPPTVTPLEGIRRAVSPGTEVRYARGCGVRGDDASGLAEARAVVRGAEVAIVCVGGKSGLLPDCTSGEFRDAADLGLTGLQERLVLEAAESGVPTVVVLCNGRALALSRIAGRVDALVEAWLPGEEGGHAIADVLFGAVNPAGRLPVTLPRSVGQVPLYYNRKWTTEPMLAFAADYGDLPASPLYPFGHGLSYTSFEYGPLVVTLLGSGAETRVQADFELRNTGRCAGDEVVQLYVQDLVASVTRPVRQLAGFVRVALEPGQTRRLRFRIHVSQLAFHDAALRFVAEPGEFELAVGASSEDLRQRARFALPGAAPIELDPRRVLPTAIEIQ